MYKFVSLLISEMMFLSAQFGLTPSTRFFMPLLKNYIRAYDHFSFDSVRCAGDI